MQMRIYVPKSTTNRGDYMSIFITIEGPNGVGKTTFIESLANALAPRTVYTTKEPSSTDFGRYVKNNEGALRGKSYAYLISADRCNHIENEIIPALRKYDIVLCDRYVESSLVLQHYDGVSLDFIWKLNEDFLVPNLSIILIANSYNLSSRLAQRKSLSVFEKVISRSEEVDLYLNAYNYVKQKGFNPIILYNDTVENHLNNIEEVKQIISSIEGDSL